MNTWTSLSNEIEAAVENTAPSVVQVHGHRRVTAGIVVADNLIVTPAFTEDDKVAVLTGINQTAEGVVLGRVGNMGLTVVRVDGLNRPALVAAQEPKPGHLAVAVGRTWSGGVMATLAPIAVVGGPLRTGRRAAIDRVIRIQQSPHGALNGGALINASGQALGIITSLAIRGTTVVIPASIAWAAATKAASEGGSKQGFIGVSSMPVPLPEKQRGGRSQTSGLLISHVAANSPAERGGLLVGDVIVGFAGEAVNDPESLVTRLRGNTVGAAVPITVIRGTNAIDVTVTVSERPTFKG
ncbi:MAG TPA: PDZ domain-containing protein [Vicinamibacterales bacterium]|nr:PDZ domain-containing protein [Vicinamibacterales bacterium]